MVQTTEEIKLKKKEYYQKNKEHILIRNKEYKELNKDRIKAYQREYRHTPEFREIANKYTREYRTRDIGIKHKRVGNWKTSGVIHPDFNELYTHYINTWECENCHVDLVEGIFGANKRTLDHDHSTGLFRNILCNTCNVRRK